MTTAETTAGHTDGSAQLTAEQVVAHGVAILQAVGVPGDDARLVSESLVTSDMWGHPSHGMLRLPWYVARIRSGVMKPVTAVETVSTFGAVTVLDGHDGVGQVVTERAVTLAGAAARTHGVGVVAVRNSNHFGTAAYWTRILAQQDCVGILTTNGSPAMAPWGGKDKMVGANPWSIAVPSASGTVVLDIANTGVARGKVYAARERGEQLPEGWAIDVDGLPTTDPQAAIDGIILPMAGHKGYAISFMMDVLSGVLTGSSYSTGVVGPFVPDRRSGCGHLVIAIAIEAVMAPGEFEHRIDDLIHNVKCSAAIPGAGDLGARRTGEPGSRTRRRDGHVACSDSEHTRGAGRPGRRCSAARRNLTMTFTVMVTLDVLPERIDEFIAGITTNAIASLRDEPGCLAFDVHRDNATLTRFHLYEIYADGDAFAVAHRSAPHYAAWQNIASHCLIEGGHHNEFATPIHLGAINAP
jgi:LDH2 family malate/lactate/ureidoglycolate dehydrogenase/quinol monooxygenase YgiN